MVADDPKTRANATGALGNFARNGERLCAELVDAGVPAALLKLARGAGECASAAERAERVAQARIALFSLGNIASHATTHEALRGCDISGALGAIEPLGDGMLDKYAARLLNKLGPPPAAHESAAR